MKKTLFLLLALLSLVTVVACEDPEEEDPAVTTTVDVFDPEDGTFAGELFGSVDPEPWG